MMDKVWFANPETGRWELCAKTDVVKIKQKHKDKVFEFLQQDKNALRELVDMLVETNMQSLFTKDDTYPEFPFAL